MRFLFFTVLLSVIQTAPPIPRQAANSTNQRTDKVGKNTGRHEKPVNPTPTPEQVTQKAMSEKQSLNNPASPNTEQSIKIRELPSVSVTRDWTDIISLAFGGILVVVGIVGVCAAFRTLRAIERQARIMRRQTGQIARQALSMRRQTTILRKTAAANKLSADAAKSSADTLIASERAWVMVDLEKVPGAGIYEGAHSDALGGVVPDLTVSVRCVCSNHGKTPAHIIEKRCCLVVATPDDPLLQTPNLDIEIRDPVPHYLGSDGSVSKHDWAVTGAGTEFPGEMVTIYGVVRYRHLFSEKEVHTTFGYRLTPDRQLERLIAYPKYNENT